MEVISTKVHGMLDYATAGLLIILPLILTLTDTVETLMMAAGIALLLLSLLTRYELSLAKWIPMWLHLVADGLLGVIFLAAAFLLDDLTSTGRALLIIFGLLELGAALFTEREWDREPDVVVRR